jgi:hypothetical protein
MEARRREDRVALERTETHERAVAGTHRDVRLLVRDDLDAGAGLLAERSRELAGDRRAPFGTAGRDVVLLGLAAGLAAVGGGATAGAGAGTGSGVATTGCGVGFASVGI